MSVEQLKKRIQVAGKRLPADLVIKNCKVVNVYTHEILEADIAVSDGLIAAVGPGYEGEQTVDGGGCYAIPGMIESHIHVESSFVSPEEFSRLVVPFGTTTAIADPHEIVNVCGMAGLDYMLRAADKAAMSIKFMLPSCVPSTPWENAGAVIDAAAVRSRIQDPDILGLGEFMNAPGVVGTMDECLAKIDACRQAGKPVDGHAPGVAGEELAAYAAAGICSDHECTTVKEMRQRLRNGMYVMLRQGSASHDLPNLVKGVTQENARRCLLCSDDRQPVTILEQGDLDDSLRICVAAGLDPVTAIQMATLNAAECYGLHDRGAIAPGLRADIVLVRDLRDFHVEKVWIEGRLTAENGRYLPEVLREDIAPVRGSVHIKDFSVDRLKMHLRSGRVHVIRLQKGSLITQKAVMNVRLDEDGDFCYDRDQDVAKVAVVERHHNTGNVATALLAGYGIRYGAVAVTVAHDSHNVIVVGVDNADMACAVKELAAQGGGVILVKDGQVLERLELPIGGLMSDRSGQWVSERLARLHELAVTELKVNPEIEPIMTLCFMSLPVIPEVKLTDMGLFDVTAQSFIPVDATDI